MFIIGMVALTISMIIMSVVVRLGVRTSRRAVEWNEKHTAETVDPEIEGMFARLADDIDPEE